MATRTLNNSIKPRKTPGQQRSAVTVAAIVEAAAHILETQGFEGYTTNAVAARAGASIGSLYQYFPNKDAITRALIQRETSTLLADVADIVSGPGGKPGMERLLAAAVEYQMRRPVLARMLDLEESRLPLGEEIEKVRSQLVTVIRHCLPPAVQDDDVLIDDLLAIVKSMVDAAGQRKERDSAALLARVQRVVFAYLAN